MIKKGISNIVFFENGVVRNMMIVLLILMLQTIAQAQSPKPKIPTELLIGNKNLYFQMVVKRSFTPTSKFKLFVLTNYTANYEARTEDNRLNIINQISYTYKKGFGVMAGADINSFKGFSPIIGPQHNFVNKKILAVTVASFFLNEQNDFKILGLYEYKPSINETWSFYSRLQFVHNRSLRSEIHNKSYIYLRAGVKTKSTIFGVGTNLDWNGPNQNFQDNYGVFVRYELN